MTDRLPQSDVVPPAVWARRIAPRLHWPERFACLIGAGLLASVLAVAAILNPYLNDAGEALPPGEHRAMGTHQQMGLPSCHFLVMSGLPCPSCGMTTSFALLMHGDPIGSWRVNGVGTFMALYCLLSIPLALFGAIAGRLPVVHSLEWWALASIGGFLPLLLVRWLWVVSQALLGAG